MADSKPVPLTSIALQDGGALELKAGFNKVTIGMTDKVVQLSHYSSYYKLLKVDHTLGSPTKITVNSYCSCFGYDKRVMIPILYGLSPTGEIIETQNVKYGLHQASGFTPLYISLEVGFSRPDVAYLVLSADNSHIDRPIQHIHIIVNNVPFGPINILSYPVGRVEVEVGGNGGETAHAGQ
ncbi:hypothetical protein KCV01_g15897, partial [Aureobasidium melanogenum]